MARRLLLFSTRVEQGIYEMTLNCERIEVRRSRIKVEIKHENKTGKGNQDVRSAVTV